MFDAVRDAFAAVVGMDTTTAGIVLGFILIVVMIIAFMWALRESMGGLGLAIPAGISATFVALIGWWPLWTIIFTALIIVLVIISPFGEGGGM